MDDPQTHTAALADGPVSRRRLLAGAAAIGAVVTAEMVTGRAVFAQAAKAGAAAPFREAVPKPLPERIYGTTANGISRRTHEEHFKLYQGYVRKFNEINTRLRDLDADPAKANQTYSEIRELKVELTFAIGGVKNHELYFDILGGDGKPSGSAADALTAAYGSIDAWKRDMKATALAARGWAWTAIDYDLGGPFNFLGDAQNAFPVWNAVPFIGLDTYEHAYYTDFGSNRGAYIDAFFKSLDWSAINRRYDQAQKAEPALRGAVTFIR